MPQPTNDAGAGEGQPKANYQNQMAEIKRNLDERAGGDSSDFNGDDEPKKDPPANAEEDDAPNGDDGNDDDQGAGAGGDAGGSDNDDDEAGAGAGDAKSEVRFSQFKGDGKPESYLKNLEEGYQNSSQEAIKLKNERDGFERQVNAITDAAEKDPEFGKRLVSLLKGNGDGGVGNPSKDKPGDSPSASEDPFLKDAKTKWNQENDKEAEEFAKANPEVLSDPKINADVKRYMRIFSNDIYEREGRLIKSGEAMEMAYRTLGLTDKRQAAQALADGMKKNAAPTRPQAKKATPSSTKQFSSLTLTIAQKMGIGKDRLEKSRAGK